jgi:hypothetical protein
MVASGRDHQQLAGLHLADDAGADGGQGGVLAGDDPAAVEPAQHQRPDALRVARGVQRVLVHPDERERAPEQRQDLEGALLEGGVGVVGEERGDQRRVVGGLLDAAAVEVELAGGAGQAGDHLAQLVGVDQVAVVTQRDGAVVGRAEGGLRVLPGAGAGRRVAGVTDRDVTLERLERGVVEDLGDQAHVLVDQDLPAVADRDSGRLLAAVLERVQAEVDELGHLFARRPDPEHAAGVLGTLLQRVERRSEPTVTATAALGGGHGRESRGGVSPDRHRRTRRTPLDARSGAVSDFRRKTGRPSVIVEA